MCIRDRQVIYLAKSISKPRELSKKNINDILSISKKTYDIIPNNKNI